ncbi:MAG4940 family membrane protein [Mycoplasma sp. 246B]
MTAKQLLSTYWNKSAFLFEFFASFTLVFFILLWLLIKYMHKPKNEKLFNTIGFTLATFLAFIIPWALSYFTANVPAFPQLNPLSVILQTRLQGFSISTGEAGTLDKGVYYLIGGQFSGAFGGLIVFAGIFFLVKNSLSKSKEYKEIFQTLQIWDLLKVRHPYNESWWKYIIKEFIFITTFVIIVPMLGYINDTNYGTNPYFKLFITLIVVWIFLFISSFFGFFAFDIVFNVIAYLLIVIEILYHLKSIKSNDQKTKQIKQLMLLETIKITTTLLFTVIIPLIYGIVAVEIGKSVPMKLNF